MLFMIFFLFYYLGTSFIFLFKMKNMNSTKRNMKNGKECSRNIPIFFWERIRFPVRKIFDFRRKPENEKALSVAV